MIHLHKLNKLPRHQRLRKCAKIFLQAESDALRGIVNREYLLSITDLLQEDKEFSVPVQEAIEKAAVQIKDGEYLERGINAIKNILFKETGKQVADWDFIDRKGTLDVQTRRSLPGMRIYLEDIRSPFNIGSIFRSAESFCVEKVYLSHLSADPTHSRSLRSAMGCVEILPWEYVEPSALTGPVFAMETGGTSLDSYTFPERGTMIIGSEEFGVSPEMLAVADNSYGRVSIPCYGSKGSLNVGVAFGIVMQAWAAAVLNGNADSRV